MLAFLTPSMSRKGYQTWVRVRVSKGRGGGGGGGIVGLVVGVGADHQFNVGAVVVGEAIKEFGGVLRAPGEEFFSGDDVVISDGHGAGVFVVVVCRPCQIRRCSFQRYKARRRCDFCRPTELFGPGVGRRVFCGWSRAGCWAGR